MKDNAKITMHAGWRKYFTRLFWKLNFMRWNSPTFEVLSVGTIEIPDDDTDEQPPLRTSGGVDGG